MNINGWEVTASECGQYLYLSLDGSPGQIHVKAESEGFIVDIWSDDDTPEVYGSAHAFYSELENVQIGEVIEN